MSINLIVAMANNRVIGNNGQMPWHLSADLKKFKAITTGFPILMGRKTHESIGKALPNRTNIIITKNPAYQATDCVVFHDLKTALDYAQHLAEQVFIIGGASLYQDLLPIADALYLTEIHQAFIGDTYFPEFKRADWTEVDRQDIKNDPSVNFSYSFVTLKKSTKSH